jgi:hypothetical protein
MLVLAMQFSRGGGSHSSRATPPERELEGGASGKGPQSGRTFKTEQRTTASKHGTPGDRGLPPS